MPYATRQGIIDFPKRKCVVKITKLENVQDVKKTPESKLITTSASSSARKAFHNCADIICREKEVQQLTDFLISHFNDQTSGSMYISGLPGTGKTATVNYIIEKNELSKKYQIVKINCTAFNSSSAVFKRICELLKLRKSTKTEKESIAAVEKYLLKKHKIILLVLDEIDQLESKNHSVLYKIFEWPSWENSKFVLIGIANAMDLTDRNLPRLCAKVELKPVLLHFAPYTKSEITEILKSRLTEAGVDKLFAPGAIELLAAKVAGTSGDIRRALDLGKRVVEIAELKNQKSNGGSANSPVKVDGSEFNSLKSLKRKLENSFPLNTPSKVESLISETLDKAESQSSGGSPQKLFRNRKNERICLGEITPQKANLWSPSPNHRHSAKSPDHRVSAKSPDHRVSAKSPDHRVSVKSPDHRVSAKSPDHRVSAKSPDHRVSVKSPDHRVPAKSPRRKLYDCQLDSENALLEGKKSPVVRVTPAKIVKEEVVLRRSPRKLQFDVNSKDVMSVVKNVFTSSSNFKGNEESIFPLHQKLLICTLLLIMKKGQKKDLNVGKLHQVYSKVCAKRGITAVDKSGFLFLCRQVEVTGVLLIGKGAGTLAKVALQWDESEVADSLKDLNLMSSILNDASCLG